MEKRIAITCPYCGHENQILVEVTPYARKIIAFCDAERGGCDTEFVAGYHFAPVAQSFGIEGFRELAAERVQPGVERFVAPEDMPW